MKCAPASKAAIAEAAAHIRAGRLVAFPTETVYGLGVDATNGRAVAAIFVAKGRPRFNPLIIHVAGLAAAEMLAGLSVMARRLAEALWPGPLTLVLTARPGNGIADLATAGLTTIALRVPGDDVALAFIEAAGRPIAAPSANRSGHVSPTCAAHVVADLGDRVAMVLDGGPTPVGVESSVLDVTGEVPLLLRPGAVTRARIEEVAGRRVLSPAAPGAGAGEETALHPALPGMLARHYGLRTPLRLDAICVGEGEALLAFGPSPPAHEGPMINLSRKGDLAEAAANLFSALRSLDAAGACAIAVMPLPTEGLGEAINDRLHRAATPAGDGSGSGPGTRRRPR